MNATICKTARMSIRTGAVALAVVALVSATSNADAVKSPPRELLGFGFTMTHHDYPCADYTLTVSRDPESGAPFAATVFDNGVQVAHTNAAVGSWTFANDYPDYQDSVHTIRVTAAGSLVGKFSTQVCQLVTPAGLPTGVHR